MLILRGNSGEYQDEDGHAHNYTKGALHEEPAKDLARLKKYTPKVLDMKGDATPPPPGSPPDMPGTNYDSPQTRLGLQTFRDDTSIRALYGFSGGGYNLYWILKQMTPAERDRVDLVVVVGVDTNRPASDFDKSKFTGAHWDLIYRPNHPKTHMFEPEALLLDEQRPPLPHHVREVRDW
jgi:hypothetical protein